MKYIIKNNDGQYEFDVRTLKNSEKIIEFKDPLEKNTVLTFNIIDKDELEFVRQSKTSYMRLNLKKDKFLEGKYKIEGYEFKIHAKCIELEINDTIISFEYKLFLNYQLENNLSIEIIK